MELLLADDDGDTARALRQAAPGHVVRVSSPQDALAVLDGDQPHPATGLDVVLVSPHRAGAHLGRLIERATAVGATPVALLGPGESLPERVHDVVDLPIEIAAAHRRLALIQRRRRATMAQRATIRALPDMMFLLDADGRLLEYHTPDPAVLHTRDLLGRTIEEHAPPSIAALVRARFEETRATGGPTVFRYTLEREGGALHHLARMYRCQGEHVLTLVRDITEEERTAEALERSLATRQALVAALPDTMFIIDAEGNLVDFIPSQDAAADALRAPRSPADDARRGVWSLGLPPALTRKYEAAIARARHTGRVEVIEHPVPGAGAGRHAETRIVAFGNGDALGLIRDISLRKDAEAHRRQIEEVTRAFTDRIIQAQETERHRLSRELHDVIGQLILVHRMDAEWLVGRSPSDELRRAAEALCSSLDETLRMVRTLAQGLRPPALDDLGIGSALEQLARDIGYRSPIKITTLVEPDVAPLSNDVGVAMYRITQEAIANAARHAGCTIIAVTLRRVTGRVELRVRDDGCGIDPDLLITSSDTLGLMSMRERAEQLGGSLSIQRNPEGGTTVLASIPEFGKPRRASSTRDRRRSNTAATTDPDQARKSGS